MVFTEGGDASMSAIVAQQVAHPALVTRAVCRQTTRRIEGIQRLSGRVGITSQIGGSRTGASSPFNILPIRVATRVRS